MLPPAPPAVSNRDFDPADVPSVNGDMDIDVEQEEEEEPEDVGSRVELSSVEINILIYLVSIIIHWDGRREHHGEGRGDWER